MISLTTKSGKYRIVQDDDGEIVIFRHNQPEPWITKIKGAKMIIELCVELEELRAKQK